MPKNGYLNNGSWKGMTNGQRQGDVTPAGVQYDLLLYSLGTFYEDDMSHSSNVL
jgi:hypothetical protein